MRKFGFRMTVRSAAIVASCFAAALWSLAAVALFFSGSDPAAKGLDVAAGVVVTAVYLVTGAPAFVLALIGRSPRMALSLALAFPAACLLLYLAAVLAFA
jgi:hypothetical protein